MYTATTVQENHFRTILITQGINHHITQLIEEDHQNEEIHRILHKIIIIDQIIEITTPDQIQIQHNLFLDPIPNQTQEINFIQTINHEIHHIIEIETIQIIEIEVIRTIEIRITRTIDQEITHITDQTITEQTIIIKTDHEIIRHSSYNNQYRNYSQSPHRNNNHYNNSKHRYRSSTPKHQRHINQVQSNEETTSDPPGIDDTGNNEL